jgi:hypothetical protein
MSVRHDPWLRRAILIGAGYVAVGLVFAAIANPAPTSEMRAAWRFAAWVVSCALFGGQISYECVRLRLTPRAVALHASLASALGGFGIAVNAAIHSRAVSGHFPSSALAVWPVIVGAPAFAVAFAAASLMVRLRKDQ